MLATGLRQHLAQGALRSTSSLLRKPLVVLPRSLSTSAQSKEAAAASSEAAQEQEAPATAAAEQKAPQVPKTPNYIEKQKKAEEYSARQGSYSNVIHKLVCVVELCMSHLTSRLILIAHSLILPHSTDVISLSQRSTFAKF